MQVETMTTVSDRPKLVNAPPQRITSDSTLVEKFSSEANSISPAPHLCKYEDVLSRVNEFNAALPKCEETNAYLLKSPSDLWNLLDMYYSHDNPLPLSKEMFPYLHGLKAVKQRAYYHDAFDVEKDFPLLSKSNKEIAEEFPEYTDMAVPNSAFHLMTVNTIESTNPSLINSVCMDDLLSLRPASCCVSVSKELEHTLYEPFQAAYELEDAKYDELNNRNYKQQIKLMAPICHFLLYNDEEDAEINREAARLIYSLMDGNPKPIYIVDFPMAQQSVIQPYMNQSVKFPFCDPSGETESSKARDRLPLLEQTLMWHLNGFKCVFNQFFVGNALTYHQLMMQPGSIPYEFGLHICCHDKARFPSKEVLTGAIAALSNKQSSQPIVIEFPDSIGRYGNSISEKELLNFLNVLRLVKLVIKNKKNVFVYSYDGFAGSSLMVSSYGLFSKFSRIEDGLLKMFLRVQPKICLTKEDFYFLKTVEDYVRWFKRLTTNNNDLVFDVALEKISAPTEKEAMKMDWFHSYNEINFPSHIYGSLFLGSAEQASSLTVLSALNIKKVISIDEKPSWFKSLNFTFQHEATDDTKGPVIKPIFTFNDGKSLVYEVSFSSDAVRSKLFKDGTEHPALTSLVYLYNIRDDGKDSFRQLLEQCPDDIQQRILADPREEGHVLYHCRVGVSRSASLIIASLMKYFCISFLESYLYVRVLRYNMIIQPNLRLFYELFTYEQHLRDSQMGAAQRKQTWWTICEQVYRLNKPYVK